MADLRKLGIAPAKPVHGYGLLHHTMDRYPEELEEEHEIVGP
jgi:hypothetical protein